MHIGAVDQAATLGTSWLHRSWPIAKLVAFALVLAAAMVTWNLLVLLGIVVLLSAAIVSSRVKPGLAFTLAAYPAFFAAVFALASAPDVLSGFVIVLKALAAGLAAVTVALTTPYPQIFAPVQRVVPGIVGDALLMTYRSTFLLLDKFANLMTAVRLRSGVSVGQPVRAARATTQALGGLLLYSFDLSQRDYDIMRVRGYQDRLRVAVHPSTSRAADAVLVATTLAALATSLLWRIAADSLNPYSWLVPIPALFALLAALVSSRRKS